LNILKIKMSKKNEDNRKQLLIRYKIDDKGCVSFIDTSCNDMPAILFYKVLKAIFGVEQDWNSKITNKKIK